MRLNTSSLSRPMLDCVFGGDDEEETMREAEKLVRRWFEEVWNQGRIEVIYELVADDYTTRGLRDATGAPSKRDSYVAFRKQFAVEFPSVKIDVEDVVADGDRLAARCAVRVVQANTGKQAEFGGMCFMHLKNGKISQAWNNFDFASMRQQLV